MLRGFVFLHSGTSRGIDCPWGDGMDAWKTACSLLPEKLAEALRQIPEAEEVRLRLGKPPGIVTGGRESRLCDDLVTRGDLQRVLEKATGASLHAAANSLHAGFVSFQGLRIGVCGEAIYHGEEMSGLRNLSSLAIRIPHACAADCGGVIEKLLLPQPQSVLICAPPGVGKTSLLRALIRRAAELSFCVGVIDERNELSASLMGAAQFELGQGSDVLVGVRKAQAAMMLLRGMNPQIIAMDEITQEDDLRAVEQIAGCGVLLFATVHGRDLADMKKRPLYQSILEGGVFQTLVTIRRVGEKRIYEREALA